MHHRVTYEPNGIRKEWKSRDGKNWALTRMVEPYRKATLNGKPIQERRIK